VPLDEENAREDEWTKSRITDLIETVHDRVRSRVRLEIDGEEARLEDLSYLGAGLEKVLSEDYQRLLAPDHVPLPKKFWGRQCRWRLVLDALGKGLRLDPADALRLLDRSDQELGIRTVGWFINLADAALAVGLDDALARARSVLADDGSRHSPAGEILLVRDFDQDSISSRLGLEKRLAPEYFSTSSPERVRGWMKSIASRRHWPIPFLSSPHFLGGPATSRCM
jgi:hypothetical protein